MERCSSGRLGVRRWNARRTLTALVLLAAMVTERRPSAQTVGGGIKGGMSFSTVTGEVDDASTLTKSLRVGWTAGGFVYFSISPRLSLQLEGLYSLEGFNGPGRLYGPGAIPPGTPGETTVTFDVFQVPVLFRVAPHSRGRASSYLVVGPGVGILLAGHRVIPGYPAFPLVNQQLKTMDVRAVIGGGVTLSHVLIEGRFTQGLTSDTVLVDGASRSDLLRKTSHRAQVISILMGLHF